MGLWIKHLLQFSHAWSGGFYATLKLPSTKNIFGSNKECCIYIYIYIYMTAFQRITLDYFVTFFCYFYYLSCKPLTYVAFGWKIFRYCKSKYFIFIFSSRLTEFSQYRWRTSSRLGTRGAATLKRIETLPPRRFFFHVRTERNEIRTHTINAGEGGNL